MEKYPTYKILQSFRILDHGKSAERLVIRSVTYHPQNRSEFGRSGLGRQADGDDPHKSGNGKEGRI
jgi:hypothetical protein